MNFLTPAATAASSIDSAQQIDPHGVERLLVVAGYTRDRGQVQHGVCPVHCSLEPRRFQDVCLLEPHIRPFPQGWYVTERVPAQVVQEGELVPIIEVLGEVGADESGSPRDHDMLTGHFFITPFPNSRSGRGPKCSAAEASLPRHWILVTYRRASSSSPGEWQALDHPVLLLCHLGKRGKVKQSCAIRSEMGKSPD